MAKRENCCPNRGSVFAYCAVCAPSWTWTCAKWSQSNRTQVEEKFRHFWTRTRRVRSVVRVTCTGRGEIFLHFQSTGTVCSIQSTRVPVWHMTREYLFIFLIYVSMYRIVFCVWYMCYMCTFVPSYMYTCILYTCTVQWFLNYLQFALNLRVQCTVDKKC